MSESSKNPRPQFKGWRSYWVWPWDAPTDQQRRGSPLRGLEVMESRRRAGKVWKYAPTRVGGGFLGSTLPGRGYEVPRS